VETDEPNYPLRRDGMVIYPVGRFTTTLCGPELLRAAGLGHIKAVHSIAWYKRETCMDTYVKALYKLRVHYEDSLQWELAAVCKAMMNALPGKMGQWDRRWIACPNMRAPCMYGEWWGSDETGEPCRYRAIGGTVQRNLTLGYSPDSCPAIAAWVQSVARIKLLDVIRYVGWHNVYYYDTDSIFMNESGHDKINWQVQARGEKIGFPTLRSSAGQLEVRGIKYYNLDGHVTCAGLPAMRATNREADQGNIVDTPPSAFFRRGQRPEAAHEQVKYSRVDTYVFGDVQPDGRVTPLHINERTY
jgi:hypothetical protein